LTYHNYINNTILHLNLNWQAHTSHIKCKPSAPSMRPELINAELRRRYLERISRKSRTQLNRSRYTKQCHFCNRLMNNAKFGFYRYMISNNSDNPHQLWNCINRTLNRKASVSLPARDSTNSLWNSLSKHFKNKITQIHAPFPVSASSCNIDFPVVHHPCTLFKPASLTEDSKLILSSPNNSCELDPNY